MCFRQISSLRISSSAVLPHPELPAAAWHLPVQTRRYNPPEQGMQSDRMLCSAAACKDIRSWGSNGAQLTAGQAVRAAMLPQSVQADVAGVLIWHRCLLLTPCVHKSPFLELGKPRPSGTPHQSKPPGQRLTQPDLKKSRGLQCTGSTCAPGRSWSNFECRR